MIWLCVLLQSDEQFRHIVPPSLAIPRKMGNGPVWLFSTSLRTPTSRPPLADNEDPLPRSRLRRRTNPLALRHQRCCIGAAGDFLRRTGRSHRKSLQGGRLLFTWKIGLTTCKTAPNQSGMSFSIFRIERAQKQNSCRGITVGLYTLSTYSSKGVADPSETIP